MLIDFNRAKKVAAGCAALTSCAFLLWVNQNSVSADANQNQNITVTQQVTSQAAPEAQAQNLGGRKPILMTVETMLTLTKPKSMLMVN